MQFSQKFSKLCIPIPDVSTAEVGAMYNTWIGDIRFIAPLIDFLRKLVYTNDKGDGQYTTMMEIVMEFEIECGMEIDTPSTIGNATYMRKIWIMRNMILGLSKKMGFPPHPFGNDNFISSRALAAFGLNFDVCTLKRHIQLRHYLDIRKRLEVFGANKPSSLFFTKQGQSNMKDEHVPRRPVVSNCNHDSYTNKARIMCGLAPTPSGERGDLKRITRLNAHNDLPDHIYKHDVDYCDYPPSPPLPIS